MNDRIIFDGECPRCGLWTKLHQVAEDEIQCLSCEIEVHGDEYGALSMIRHFAEL